MIPFRSIPSPALGILYVGIAGPVSVGYKAHERRGHAKHEGHFSLRDSSLKDKGSYFLNLSIGKFCGAAALSNAYATILHCVSVVLGLRAPFKVRGVIILFITIPVIYLRKIAGVWYERFSNKSMNELTNESLVLRNHHGLVAMRERPEREHSPFAAPSVKSARPYMAFVANFVAGVNSGYFSPFHNRLVSTI